MCLLFAALLVSGCDRLDQHFVYAPEPWESRDWLRESRLPLEDVWLEPEPGVRLYGWFVKSPDSPNAILWCHGNAGNITFYLNYLRELHARGLSVLVFDYRGYGRSTGVPSEPGFYRDALAAYDYLRDARGFPPVRIILVGRSLGGAVGAEVALQRPAAGLVLEMPVPSIALMAKRRYGPLPAHWFLKSRFDLLDKVRRVTLPVLVMHGDRDALVPLAYGRNVYEAAGASNKTFYEVPGGDHGELYRAAGDAYFRRLLTFIELVAS